MSGVNHFFAELKRRKVLGTVLPYVGLVWLLLQVISVVVPLLTLPPLAGTFLAVLLFALFPVVCYLDWFYDITSDGLMLTPLDDQGTVSPPGWKHWLVLAFIMLMSFALGLNYFLQVRDNARKAAEGTTNVALANSIAVAGFKDLSPEQDQQYLAEGLTEEITSVLGKMPGLTVAASGSGLVLSQQGLDAVAIGRRLEVATVLTGSVRRNGDQLKIRLELLDSRTGHTLWTENLQRQLLDVFAMETEVARSVVNLLQDNYLDQQSISNNANTQSVDAYVLYLKGREQYRRQTTEALKQARILFEQATTLDPEYAQAHVALADTFVLLSDGKAEFGVLKAEIAAQLASQSLAKALLRAPNMAEAFAVQGKVFEFQQQDDAALAAYDKAISLNPNLAVAHMWRYLLLKLQGRYQESLLSLQQALRLDPVSVAAMYNNAFELAARGEYAQAEQRYQQLLQDFPTSPWGYAGLGNLAWLQGNLAESLKHWQQAHQLSPQNQQFKSSYISLMLKLGMVEQARPLATEDYYQATLQLLSGDYKALFASMEFQLAADPDNGWLAFEAGWYQLLVGEPALGISLMLQAKQQIPPAEWFDMPMCSPAIEFAWVLQQQGEKAEANALADQCQQQLETARNGHILDQSLDYLAVRLWMLKDEPQQAVIELKNAIAHGWQELWLTQDPLLLGLNNQPEFQTISAALARNMAAEKQQALMLLQQPAPPPQPKH